MGFFFFFFFHNIFIFRSLLPMELMLNNIDIVFYEPKNLHDLYYVYTKLGSV